MAVGVVYQHLAFFRQGSTLLGRIEGPYSDAMAIVEHMCKEGQAKEVGWSGSSLAADRHGQVLMNHEVSQQSWVAFAVTMAPHTQCRCLASCLTITCACLQNTVNQWTELGNMDVHLTYMQHMMQAALEDMIRATRDTTAAREALILREAAAAAAAATLHTGTDGDSPAAAAVCCAAPTTVDAESQSPMAAGHTDLNPGLAHSPLAQGALGSIGPGYTGSPAGSGGVLSGFAGLSVISAAPGGPVQLTAAAAGMVGDIERLISSTRSSGGTQVGYICGLHISYAFA